MLDATLAATSAVMQGRMCRSARIGKLQLRQTFPTCWLNVMAVLNVTTMIVMLSDNGTSEPATDTDAVCADSKGKTFLRSAAEPIN